MGEYFKTLEDISRFYSTVGEILIWHGSFSSFNRENEWRYAALPEYGETRFLSGSLLPPEKELEGIGKLCDDATHQKFKDLFPDYKRENIGLHRKVMMLFLNGLKAEEDIRLVAKNIGAHALVRFESEGFLGNSSYIPRCRGVPVRRI